MHRPSAAFSVQSEAPVTIESRALGTLAFIRTSIESSSSMDVPGMAGIVIGIIGILAAIVVSLPPLGASLARNLAVRRARCAAVRRCFGARQIAPRGRTRYLGPARKFLLCLCPALLAGAVLTWVLWSAGLTNAIPGMWLLLYGCAVLSASTVTIAGIARLICIMGALFVALGTMAFVMPPMTHTAMLGLGFGVLHIVFGLLIGRVTHAG